MRLKKTTLLSALLLCVLFTALPALAAEKPELEIADKLKLKEEESAKLTVSIDPKSANIPALVWKSSDDSVASVDTSGVVTAKKAGKATITVQAVDDSAEGESCALTVTAPKRTPVDGAIEGNVYNPDCVPLDDATLAAVRDYCEKLGDSKGEKAVRAALGYLGTSYNTLDCSKLAQYAYKAAGMKISRVSDEQAQDLIKGKREDGVPRVGDIFFMKFPSWRTTCSCGTSCRRFMGIHHSAMYLGTVGGRSYVVDSSSRVGKVIIRQFSGSMIAGMPVVFVAGKSTTPA